jgi:hypothetical protein
MAFTSDQTMSNLRAHLRHPPPAAPTDPQLLREMSRHSQIADDAEAAIQRRILDLEATATYPSEIDPRDAYYLNDLAKRAADLESRLRIQRSEPVDELRQRYIPVRDFWRVQPEFVRQHTLP